MRVVDEELSNGPRRVSLALRSVVHEEDDLHQGYKDHADRRRPAAVLLLVCAVCVREEGFAGWFDVTQDGGKGRETGMKNGGTFCFLNAKEYLLNSFWFDLVYFRIIIVNKYFKMTQVKAKTPR